MRIKTLLILLSLPLFFYEHGAAQWPVYTEDIVVDAQEVQPVFRGGGADTFADWVKKQVLYSSNGQFLTKVDMITVSFTVDKKGKIRNVVGGYVFYPQIRDEVLKVIGKAPDMTPGTRDGQPAEFQLTTEIKFAPGLREEKPKFDENQTESEENQTESDENQTESDENQSKSVEEIFPQFTQFSNQRNKPLALYDLRAWILKEIRVRYRKPIPADSKVVVEFVVNKGGYVENVEIIESSSQSLERLIVQTMYECPKWYSPGYLNGEPVRVSFLLPITLRTAP